MSVVTAHMVYFCAFARSEIFQKNARKSGVGRGQFDAGVNGLSQYLCTVLRKSEKYCDLIFFSLSKGKEKCLDIE